MSTMCTFSPVGCAVPKWFEDACVRVLVYSIVRDELIYVDMPT